MIKVYSSNKDFLVLLDTYKDAFTEEILSTGQKTLCFKVPCVEEMLKYIQEENYIETPDYSYVIKEINMEDNDFIEVRCSANIEDIKGRLFTNFDCYQLGIQQAYEYCLSKSPSWKVEYNSSNRQITTYQEPNVFGFDMILRIAEDYQQEFWFDTKNHILKIYDKMGKSFGAYYSNELKMRQLIKQSSTYDYATVLYPIGKNGLTIGVVNNNKNFLENYSYSNKHIEKLFIDNECEVAEILKAKAEAYLDEICVPRASYQVRLTDLGDTVALGDTIILVDKIKQIKQKQRVVKITRYLKSPENSYVEISNLQVNFATHFVKSQKKLQSEIRYIRRLLEDMRQKT